MVRVGAAVFALYLMHRSRKLDDPLLWAAFIILGLVAYTWYQSKRTIEPGGKRPRATGISPEERKCDTMLTIVQGRFPNCWQVTAYTLALRCLYDELPDELRDHIYDNYVLGPGSQQGVCYTMPKSIVDTYSMLFPLATLNDPTKSGGNVEKLFAAILYMCGDYEETWESGEAYVSYGDIDPGPGQIQYPKYSRQMINVHYDKKEIYGFDQIYKDIEHLFDRSVQNPYGVDGGWVYVEIVHTKTGNKSAHAIPFTVCRRHWTDSLATDQRWKIILCNQYNTDCSDGALKRYLMSAKQGGLRRVKITEITFLAGESLAKDEPLVIEKKAKKGSAENPIVIDDPEILD
jgi:hypothetical protein